MANRASSVPQLDLFVPALSDIQLRDQRETMERPFFSLSKRKRLTPINYVSPDGSVTVIVKPHQDYGMPTIWDADLLIWAASTLNDMKKRGLNDIPRRLTAKPYELLKAIGRDAGGSDCRQLHDAALRLRNVSITTNLRSKTGEKPENFSWLDKVSVTKRGGEEGGERQYASFTITVSDWFYDAVLEEGALLAIDPAYFTITGGRERWLYRVVRKHAGGAGSERRGHEISDPVREIRGRRNLPPVQVRADEDPPEKRDTRLRHPPRDRRLSGAVGADGAQNPASCAGSGRQASRDSAFNLPPPVRHHADTRSLQLPRPRRLLRQIGFRRLPRQSRAARRLPESLLRFRQAALATPRRMTWPVPENPIRPAFGAGVAVSPCFVISLLPLCPADRVIRNALRERHSRHIGLSGTPPRVIGNRAIGLSGTTHRVIGNAPFP